MSGREAQSKCTQTWPNHSNFAVAYLWIQYTSLLVKWENLENMSVTQTLVDGSNERIITLEGARECIVYAVKVIIPILIDRKTRYPR